MVTFAPSFAKAIAVGASDAGSGAGDEGYFVGELIIHGVFWFRGL
jgi:hypothetical protein